MFEIVFGVLIAVNAMLMAMEIQYEGSVTAYKMGYKGAGPPDEVWQVYTDRREYWTSCVLHTTRSTPRTGLHAPD